LTISSPATDRGVASNESRPDEIAAEIVENLEAALDRSRKIALSLQAGAN
jgi:hypothetical protein